ncbi:MAG: hypothetical protein U5J83_09115 [Bryobacterales bacterium]|nr:hypothetical protein [Bryobacterales bacterium]
MKLRAIALLLIAGTMAFAWEETLSRLGITRQQLESNLVSALAEGEGLLVPRIPKEAVESYRSMAEPARVAVVKDGIAAAKTILMSEAFTQAADERVRKERGGIDHGLKVPSDEELNRQQAARKITSVIYQKAMDRIRFGGLAERAFRDPADSLRSRLEGELRSAEYMAKQMPQEKPDPAKRVELLKAALAVPASDEAAFRRAVAAALCFGAGGPDDSAEAEVLAKEEQQRIYDQYAWKGTVRRGLTTFIESAGKVNFAAATVAKGNKIVFTEPAMERAPASQKFLYRLGKAPTMAAVAEAKALLAELK